jgi:hypothetical protein
VPQRATNGMPKASGIATRTSGIATRTVLLIPGGNAAWTRTMTAATRQSVFQHLAVNRTARVAAGRRAAAKSGPVMVAEAILPGAAARVMLSAAVSAPGKAGTAVEIVRGPRHPETGVTANE